MLELARTRDDGRGGVLTDTETSAKKADEEADEGDSVG